ncbi:hypothetical protein GGS26DRAFT_595718 [Hypomontagnella submonticulosa]|nr:hypothetical protein GGS26DRAFT_595718 [Hypomontagnella submonticulosa]
MALDRIDDDSCWDGGKVVPWPQGGYVAQQILPSYVDELEGFDGLNFESPNAKTLNRLNMETLTEFEALMLGELSTDGSSEDEIETVTTSTEDEAPFPFMELPLEIRLQVYRWLHLMTPITLTQFAPWYPNPVYRSYHVKTVTLGDDINTLGVEPGALVASQIPKPLLSPSRPHCCMPTAMLLASRQIYYETRQIPFLENEFVFVNWFASGLWAARTFTKGLRPWQHTMRYARLELLSRDLSGRHAEEWKELCKAWSTGLRGLRLKILSGGGASGGVAAARGVSWVVAGLPERGAPTVRVRDSEGRVEGWVEKGLKRLRYLRCLEVELSVPDWDDGAKLDWCRCLEQAVNEAKADTEPQVRVLCVERDARD